MAAWPNAVVTAYHVATAISAHIPPRMSDPAIDLVGDLLWQTNRAARRAVEANLLRVIGQRNRRWERSVRLVFRNGVRYYYATFRTPLLTPHEIMARMSIVGWSNVDAALSAGRGAILVSPHSSGIGMGGQAVAARGLPVTVAVEPIEPPELLDYMCRIRQGVGVRMVPLGPRLGVELVRALRRNEVVALIADRDIAANSMTVPFFGAPAPLPTGPALLALRTGAALLPCFAIALRGGRYRGVIEAPIPVDRKRDTNTDVERITRAVAGRLEYHIARYPAHWTVFQPIWGPGR